MYSLSEYGYTSYMSVKCSYIAIHAQVATSTDTNASMEALNTVQSYKIIATACVVYIARNS